MQKRAESIGMQHRTYLVALSCQQGGNPGSMVRGEDTYHLCQYDKKGARGSKKLISSRAGSGFERDRGVEWSRRKAEGQGPGGRIETGGAGGSMGFESHTPWG